MSNVVATIHRQTRGVQGKYWTRSMPKAGHFSKKTKIGQKRRAGLAQALKNERKTRKNLHERYAKLGSYHPLHRYPAKNYSGRL